MTTQATTEQALVDQIPVQQTNTQPNQISGAQTPPEQTPWYAKEDYGLSPETQTYLAGKQYADIETSIKSLKQFENLARDRNAMHGPQEGKLLEWDAWEKLGWSQDRQKYNIEPPKLKEGVPYDPEFHKFFTDVLHEGKVPLPIANKIMENFGKGLEQGYQADLEEEARLKTSLQEGLKNEWGRNYDRNFENARRAANFLGIGKDDQTLMEDALSTPQMLKIFHKIGSMIGEDKLVTSENSSVSGSYNHLSQIKAKRQALFADKEFQKIINDRSNPLYEQKTTEWNNLTKAEYELMNRK